MTVALAISIPVVFTAGLIALLVHLHKTQHIDAEEHTDHTIDNILKGDK